MEVQNDQPLFPVERIGYAGLPATLGNKLARMHSLYETWWDEHREVAPKPLSNWHD
jgi:hypothetical protein